MSLQEHHKQLICVETLTVWPLCRFLRSDTAKEFVGFISALNDAVKGRSSTDTCSMSRPVLALVDALKKMREWVDEIPPQQQSLRYGNPAYRCDFRSLPATRDVQVYMQAIKDGAEPDCIICSSVL